jgi:hypothetical protein
VRKIPKKKPKTTEEHLETVELLLAGLLLGRQPDVKQVAKVIGVSDKVLSALYPQRKERKNDGAASR